MPIGSGWPPSSAPRPLNLERLAQTDPQAAATGVALNDPRQGGVDLDGRLTELSWDEFALVAEAFARAFPQVTPALYRLQAAFFAASSAGPAPNDPGRGLVDPRAGRSASDAQGNETGGVVHVGDRSLLLFDRGDRDYTRAEIRVAVPGGPSRALFPDGPGPLQLSPSFAAGQVFFLAAPSTHGPARLYRAPFDGERAGAAVEVPGLKGLGPLSWPTVHVLRGGGGLIVAFRDELSRPRLAYSPDGASFVPLPGTVEPTGAAMVELGVFGSGALAMTYQRDDGGAYTSYVRLSRDGRTWSARVPITQASNNVHDTTLVSRSDGGLDCYYVYTTPSEGFALYRRALREDGTFGPEQRVTLPGPDINKPRVSRGPDGKLHVAFVEVTSRGPGGWVDGQTLRTLILEHDAPAPC